MNWMFAFNVCVIVVVCLCSRSSGLEVTSPTTWQPKYYPTPVIHRFGLINFPAFSGPVAIYPGPAVAPGANLTGLIALIPAEGALPGRGIESKARAAKQAGAIAVIVMSEIPSPISGFSDIVWNDCCAEDVAIPVVELSLYDSIAWLMSGENFTVYINDSDPNPWRRVSVESGYHVYFGLVWCLVAAAITLFASFKLYRYWRARGPEMAAGFLFLVIEVFCNFERFIFYLLDPMFTRQFFPHVVISVLYTFTTPFTFIGCLLITLTWVEIQYKAKYLSKENAKFLSRSRIPFIIVSTLLVIFEVIISVMRGLMFNVGDLIAAIWGIQGILGIVFSIVFWVQGYRLLVLIRDTADVTDTSEAQKTTRDLIYSGIFLVGFSIMLFVSCTPQVHFGTVNGWYSIQNLWMFFISLVSLTQLLAMPTAKPRGGSSSNSTTSKSKRTINTANNSNKEASEY